MADVERIRMAMVSRWEDLLDAQEVDVEIKKMTQAIVDGLRQGFEVAFVTLNEDGDVPVQDVQTFLSDESLVNQAGGEGDADLLLFAEWVLEQHIEQLKNPDTDLVWIKKDAHGDLAEMRFPLDELEEGTG